MLTSPLQAGDTTEPERLVAQLAALDEAVMALTAELALDRVLERIVEIATRLVGARYGALGVPDGRGGLVTFVTTGLTAEERVHLRLLPRGTGLLGVLLRDPQPIRLRDVAADPRSAGFPAHHPLMRSFLGVPIVGKGQIRGSLYLTEKRGADEFSEDDEWLVGRLAAHAAIAIENARLHAEVGRLAVVEERQRIGMDLHDGIIQSIYAVGLTLESARHTLAESPSVAQERVGQAIEGLNGVIRDLRSYVLDLKPLKFQGGDLVAGLKELARAFYANTLTAVEVEAEAGVDAGLTSDEQGALFHIAQEALANAAKHARASRVRLGLRRVDEWVELTIEDNGRGFDQGKVHTHAGHGLENMRERAKGIGGEFQLASAEGRGTRLEMRMQLKA